MQPTNPHAAAIWLLTVPSTVPRMYLTLLQGGGA